MPITIAAYDLANRSSEVTADVVARLGFIPDRVEKKLTVGQQRRGRRKKLKGRGGSEQAWKIFQDDALRRYMREKDIDIPAKATKTKKIQVLIASDDASPDELNTMIRAGIIRGGVVNYLKGKAPVTEAEAREAADQLRQTTAQPAPTGQPAPAPEEESLTYSQPPANPAEAEPPSGVPPQQVAPVQETALVQQATSQILDDSGFNGLDEIDTVDDVVQLKTSIRDVAKTPPQGVAAAMWGLLANAAGHNMMKAVQDSAPTGVVRAAAQTEAGQSAEATVAFAADHVDSVDQSVSSYQSTTLGEDRPDAQIPLGTPTTPSRGNASSGVDLSTAEYTPGSAAPLSFAVSPVQAQQQAAMTSAIIDAVNDSQDARDTVLLAPLEQTTNLIRNTNRLLGSLNTQQLAAINRLGPELQTKLVTDRQLDRDEVPKVLDVLKNDPDIAELLRQGLVQPEQLKDPAYVASLRMNLLKNKSEGRPANLRGRVRASKAPVFKRQVASRRTPGLRYYKRARHVAPSIFAR
jgi:hypothetical protein